MSTSHSRASTPVVLQAKFAAWLSWSQPFLHRLLSGLDLHVRNVVLCNRTERLDRFPVREICRVPARFLFQPRLTAATAVYLRRRYDPDLIHAHFGWSGLRVLLLKQMLRVPLVVTFGGRDLGVQSKLPAFRGAYRALFEAADRVICVSKDLASRAAAAGVPEERIHTIYRGTDLSQFRYVDRGARDAEGPVDLLMVGRLTAKKGHADALRALRCLLDDGDDVRLTIVGEGDEERSIRKLIRKLHLHGAVRLVGSKDPVGVREHMAEADLLLHPAVVAKGGDVEGIPNVVVEAHATGLPIVATRHGGIPEVVVPGETGELVPEGDPEALAAALAPFTSDRALRLRFGEAAHQRAISCFDLNQQIAGHEAIYRELTERARTDSTWRGRVVLPEDVADRLKPLSGYSKHPSEYSLAELFEELVNPPSNRASFDDRRVDEIERENSALDRLYELKSEIPTSIKYPLKRIVAGALTRLIAARRRLVSGKVDGGGAAADALVLTYFRGGGKLPDCHPDEVYDWVLNEVNERGGVAAPRA